MANLGKNNGPYSLDYQLITHRECKVSTIVGTDTFDILLSNLETYYEYEVGFVPDGYEHRPDLISNVFYGSPKNWWLLMLVNGITDPFEGFKSGEKILIPKL